VVLLAAPVVCYALGTLLEAALGERGPLVPSPARLFRRLLLGLLPVVWLAVLLAAGSAFSLPLLAGLTAAGGAALLGMGLVRGARRPRAPKDGGASGPHPQPLSQGERGDGGAGPLHRPRQHPLPQPLFQGERGNGGGWWEAVALAALLLGAALLFGRPGEDVLGARDPGIYYATGVGIARQGSILQHDKALRALAADLGGTSINYWLFQSVHGWPLRYPGQYFVRDLAAGLVEPGFLPWYSVTVALAVAMGGLAAGLWVNPALSVLAVAAVYLAGREAFGPAAAWAGAALLTLDLAQVWFARSTLAEPAAQLLVWTGLYALVAGSRRPSLALGALAGLAWAGLLLTRVEGALLVPPVVGLLLWQARRPRYRPPARLALGLIAVGAGHAVLHARWLAPGYASMVFSPATLAVAAGGIVVALASAALAALALPRLRRSGPGGRLLVLGGLAAVLAFAYLVRPALPLPLPGGEAGELEIASRESLVRLGWYVTPLGLALALGGLAAALWTRRWVRAAPVLLLVLLALAFYLPNPLVSSDQPWAARRYLPVVLPGLLLLAGFGAVSVGRIVARVARSRAGGALGRGLGWATAGVLLLTVAVGEWQATAPVLAHQEAQGAVAQVEALAALFPPDAIVLFPRSTAGMRLAQPLHAVGERATFVLPALGPEADVLAVVRRWRERGRPVSWVVPQGTRVPTPRGFRFAPAGQFTFSVPQLERPLDRLPRAVAPLVLDLQVYRVELADAG
jgi:hypothetical protein